jgi:hypothetical protein
VEPARVYLLKADGRVVDVYSSELAAFEAARFEGGVCKFTIWPYRVLGRPNQ